MKETPAQGFGRAGSIEIIILFTAFIAATYGFGIYLLRLADTGDANRDWF